FLGGIFTRKYLFMLGAVLDGNFFTVFSILTIPIAAYYADRMIKKSKNQLQLWTQTAGMFFGASVFIFFLLGSPVPVPLHIGYLLAMFIFAYSLGIVIALKRNKL